MKIALITIGNEILLGKTINTNLAFIGDQLMKIGSPLNQSMTIRDSRENIIEALEDCWQNHDIVITTGGLGPTTDDITKKTVAEFFDKDLYFDEDIWKYVKSRFKRRNMDIPEINKTQAEVPVGFETIHNNCGTAPGLFYKEDGKMFFATPGVPREMKYIFETGIIPMLSKESCRDFYIKTMHTIDLSESAIAEILADIDVMDGVEVAFLPQAAKVSVRVYGTDESAFKHTYDYIHSKLADYIWGYDNDTLISVLHNKLIEKKMTISFAESCTGGMAQEMLTAQSGSSAYFPGGVVTYSNEVKSGLLGINMDIIEQHGAVSKETAIQMADKTARKFNTDIAGAITGIAGPTGGTADKPVGTVHIAAYIEGKLVHKLLNLRGNRNLNRSMSVDRLIHLIIKNI